MKFYALWDSGRESAPDLVKCVFECWEREVGTDNFVVLDENDLAQAIEDVGLTNAGLGIANRSDVLRAVLLANHGGAWVDATVLPMPGSAALLPRLVKPSGFFALRGPAKDRLISSFLLAASPGNRLAKSWLDTLVTYHSVPRRDVTDRRRSRFSIRRKLWMHKAKRDPVWSVTPGGGADAPFRPYFAFHYLFARLIATDPDLARIWHSTPAVSAIPVMMMQRLLDFNDATTAGALLPEVIPLAPFHKLSWKKHLPIDLLEDFRSGRLPTMAWTPPTIAQP